MIDDASRIKDSECVHPAVHWIAGSKSTLQACVNCLFTCDMLVVKHHNFTKYYPAYTKAWRVFIATLPTGRYAPKGVTHPSVVRQTKPVARLIDAIQPMQSSYKILITNLN